MLSRNKTLNREGSSGEWSQLTRISLSERFLMGYAASSERSGWRFCKGNGTWSGNAKLGLTILWPNKEKCKKEKNNLPDSELRIWRKQHTKVHLKIIGKLWAAWETGHFPFAGGAGLRHAAQRKIFDKPGMPSRRLISQGNFPHTMSASEGKPQTHRTLPWKAFKPRTWPAHRLPPFGKWQMESTPKPSLLVPRKACVVRDRLGSCAYRAWGKSGWVSVRSNNYTESSPPSPLKGKWSPIYLWWPVKNI